MGCTSSSLAGPTDLAGSNDFSHLNPTITPSRHTKHHASDPVESPLSAEAYAHTIPTMTRSDRGEAEEIGNLEPKPKLAKEQKVLLPHDFHLGHSKRDVYGSETHPKPGVPKGKRGEVVPFPR